MRKYNVLLADPPWRYDNVRTGGGLASGAAAKYATLSLAEIQQIDITPIAPDAVVFLWCPVPLLEAYVETWVATQLGGLRNDTVSTSGDNGYDCAVRLGCVTLRVDAVHAGFHPDGTPRGRECHLIVNCDSPKLYRSDVLVLVTGPPFAFLGGVPTARFLAQAVLQDFGYGAKFALPASNLVNVASLFRREVRPAWHGTTD